MLKIEGGHVPMHHPIAGDASVDTSSVLQGVVIISLS